MAKAYDKKALGAGKQSISAGMGGASKKTKVGNNNIPKISAGNSSMAKSKTSMPRKNVSPSAKALTRGALTGATTSGMAMNKTATPRQNNNRVTAKDIAKGVGKAALGMVVDSGATAIARKALKMPTGSKTTSNTKATRKTNKKLY